MIKKILLGFALLLFIVQGVFAVDTEIKIKTIPFADVQVSILKDSSVLESMTKVSDGYGDVRFIFSIKDDSYSVIVFAKQNYKNIMEPEKLLDQNAGEPLLIEMLPEGFTAIETPNKTETTNTTEIQENVSAENNTQENQTIVELVGTTNGTTLTGAVVGEGIFSKIGYYIVGGILALGMIAFLIVKILSKRGSPKEVKVKKLSEINQNRERSLKERMDDAEKRIEDARRELEDIRKQKDQGVSNKYQAEIEEAKKKLIEDEKRLIELRNRRD